MAKSDNNREPRQDVVFDELEGDYSDSLDDGYYDDYNEVDGAQDGYEGDEGEWNETPPKKQRKPLPPLVRSVVFTGVILAVSVVLAIFLWLAADDVLALTKTDNVVTVTINDGATLGDVADVLKDHGLIRYKSLFKLYGTFSHAESKFHAGTYDLNQQFDYHALVDGLAASSDTRRTVTLTFPEGYNETQIFQMLVDNDICTLEELNNCAANYAFDYSFLEGLEYGNAERLEGYLFPDTYDFYAGDDPETVINKFLSNFNSKFDDSMRAAIDTLNANLRSKMEAVGTYSEEEIQNAMMDIHKIVTVASLIEKEAGSASERTTIASVIYNRLTSDLYSLLQIDATVEFALGEHKVKLTDQDYQVDSPYNTYKYEGLPPGPIANPGLSSLKASLYPEDTGYYFYALDADGTHRFFTNYPEQQAFLTGQDTGAEQEAAVSTNPEPIPTASSEATGQDAYHATTTTGPDGEEQTNYAQ